MQDDGDSPRVSAHFCEVRSRLLPVGWLPAVIGSLVCRSCITCRFVLLLHLFALSRRDHLPRQVIVELVAQAPSITERSLWRQIVNNGVIGAHRLKVSRLIQLGVLDVVFEVTFCPRIVLCFKPDEKRGFP
nr:hypothetical protein [Serratia marcescens]